MRRGNGGSEPGPRVPRGGAARHGPRAGEIPGGGAARSRSGAETATDTVVEERDRGIRAGLTGPRGGAARRGPRAGENPGGGAARSQSGAETGRPAGRPEKARTSWRNGSCKESVPRAEKTMGRAGVLARHDANRAEIEGGS